MAHLAADFHLLLALTLLLMAVLYSSVGHGGASGYLAAMIFWGLSVEVMRPAALAMNIVVTGWLLYRFKPYQLIPYRLFWPLVLAATPMAFVGGYWRVDSELYRWLVGCLLLVAAVQMVRSSTWPEVTHSPPLWVSIPVGGTIGFMAGVTGIGGGVFLSPLLLIFGWCTMRQSAAIAAGFILLNSASGLAGYFASGQSWPAAGGWMLVAALAGCLLGAELATRRASTPLLKRLLAVVLAIAGLKMLVI